MEKTVDFYFNNYKSISTIYFTDYLKNMADMLIKYDSQKLNNYVIYKIKKVYNEGNIEESISLIEKFLELNIDKTGVFRKLSLLLEKDKIVNEEDLKNQISKQIEKIQSLEDYFTLTAYMIAKLEPYLYEIALPQYNVLGGMTISAEHALLITTDTSFHSKGWFDLNVTKLQEMPITLKEEFGGFTQNFNVYMEISDNQIETIEVERNILKDLEKKMEEINSIKKEIKAIFNSGVSTYEKKQRGLSVTERLKNDKILQVLSMNKQEVLSILGKPDREDWFAGEYIFYEDASPLIQNNDNGATDETSLLIWMNDYDDIVMVCLSSFLDIETGMSFTKAMDILNQELEVFEDKVWGEFGDYYMNAAIEDYNISFYANESIDGPIHSIYVAHKEK